MRVSHIIFCWIDCVEQAIQQKMMGGGILVIKARDITSGETPQKSLILPPVHTFIKRFVAPVNLIFSYFLRISGG